MSLSIIEVGVEAVLAAMRSIAAWVAIVWLVYCLRGRRFLEGKRSRAARAAV
jgi:hypothetical protein